MENRRILHGRVFVMVTHFVVLTRPCNLKLLTIFKRHERFSFFVGVGRGGVDGGDKTRKRSYYKISFMCLDVENMKI